MDLISKAYILALLGSTAFLGVSAARIHWTIRRSKRAKGKTMEADWQELVVRVHNRFQFLFLLFLLFGLAAANAVFGSLRAAHYSFQMGHGLERALELPTVFSFVWLCIFVGLHSLLWFTKTRIKRTRHQEGFR